MQTRLREIKAKGIAHREIAQGDVHADETQGEQDEFTTALTRQGAEFASEGKDAPGGQQPTDHGEEASPQNRL